MKSSDNWTIQFDNYEEGRFAIKVHHEHSNKVLYRAFFNAETNDTSALLGEFVCHKCGEKGSLNTHAIYSAKHIISQ